MPIDPQLQSLLCKLDEQALDLSTCSLDELRAQARRHWLPAGPAAHVERFSMPASGGELSLLAYRPVSTPHGDELRGGLVFFPGGGFVVGELEGHDALCRQLAIGAQCVVVSVDYRLAPEQRFPAAVDDAYAATCFIHEQADSFGIDHRRLAIGGYSAGATLATVVARLAKERRNPALSFQLLIQPITDLRGFDTPSHLEYAQVPPFTRASIQRLIECYVRSAADRADARCSPLVAKNLIGLPPALIITAECDPFRDEADAYAAALRAAHVSVTSSRYDGMIHGFVLLHAVIERGRSALDECIQMLQAALAPSD